MATATEQRSSRSNKLDRVKAKIKEQVFALLGRPRDVWRVDVHLYDYGRARINIWRRERVRPEKESGFIGALGKPELIDRTHITDSFYLYLSKSAIIEQASPQIKRRYQVSKEETLAI